METPTIATITQDAIDISAFLERLALSTTGAVAVFIGLVRAVSKFSKDGDVSVDKVVETKYLEYDSYKSMAEAKMNQIVNEIRSNWPDVEGVAIVQRVGRLLPGTPTVMIACAASRRDTGIFEATRYGIDRLKEIVPIWKMEIGIDGESWVEGSYFPKPGD